MKFYCFKILELYMKKKEKKNGSERSAVRGEREVGKEGGLPPRPIPRSTRGFILKCVRMSFKVKILTSYIVMNSYMLIMFGVNSR